MKIGTYGPRNTDFKKLRIERAELCFFDKVVYGETGCGANALALLTGVNPLKFKTWDGLYPDNFMLYKLRAHGYSVYEVTKANLTFSKTAAMIIDDRHLILYSSLLSRGIASWFVSFNNMVVHNFDVFAPSYWALINSPIHSMFVLHKKKLTSRDE